MALDKTTLKNTLVNMMNALMAGDKEGIEVFASEFTNALDVYVKGADIKYNGGLTAPNGAVGGTFNGKLE